MIGVPGTRISTINKLPPRGANLTPGIQSWTGIAMVGTRHASRMIKQSKSSRNTGAVASGLAVGGQALSQEGLGKTAEAVGNALAPFDYDFDELKNDIHDQLYQINETEKKIREMLKELEELFEKCCKNHEKV